MEFFAAVMRANVARLSPVIAMPDSRSSLICSVSDSGPFCRSLKSLPASAIGTRNATASFVASILPFCAAAAALSIAFSGPCAMSTPRCFISRVSPPPCCRAPNIAASSIAPLRDILVRMLSACSPSSPTFFMPSMIPSVLSAVMPVSSLTRFTRPMYAPASFTISARPNPPAATAPRPAMPTISLLRWLNLDESDPAIDAMPPSAFDPWSTIVMSWTTLVLSSLKCAPRYFAGPFSFSTSRSSADPYDASSSIVSARSSDSGWWPYRVQ